MNYSQQIYKDREKEERYWKWLKSSFEEDNRRIEEEEAAQEQQAARQQQAEEKELAELEGRRAERIAKEQYAAFTPEQQAEFESMYGSIPTLKRLAALARLEADAKFEQSEREREESELKEFGQEGSQGQKKKMFEIAELSAKRAAVRLENRRKRELRSEYEADDGRRILSTLDANEITILNRLLTEEPSMAEQVAAYQADKDSSFNPIADINDPATLYRLANRKPQNEAYIPPTSQIAEIENPKVLYKMASRDIRENMTKRRIEKQIRNNGA